MEEGCKGFLRPSCTASLGGCNKPRREHTDVPSPSPRSPTDPGHGLGAGHRWAVLGVQRPCITAGPLGLALVSCSYSLEPLGAPTVLRAEARQLASGRDTLVPRSAEPGARHPNGGPAPGSRPPPAQVGADVTAGKVALASATHPAGPGAGNTAPLENPSCSWTGGFSETFLGPTMRCGHMLACPHPKMLTILRGEKTTDHSKERQGWWRMRPPRAPHGASWSSPAKGRS